MSFEPIRVFSGRASVPSLKEFDDKTDALESELTNRYGPDFRNHSKGGAIWDAHMANTPADPAQHKLYHGSYGEIPAGDTIHPGMSMRDSAGELNEEDAEDYGDTPLSWASDTLDHHNYSHIYEVEPIEVHHDKRGDLTASDVEKAWGEAYVSPTGYRVKQQVWSRNDSCSTCRGYGTHTNWDNGSKTECPDCVGTGLSTSKISRLQKQGMSINDIKAQQKDKY